MELGNASGSEDYEAWVFLNKFIKSKRFQKYFGKVLISTFAR